MIGLVRAIAPVACVLTAAAAARGEPDIDRYYKGAEHFYRYYVSHDRALVAVAQRAPVHEGHAVGTKFFFEGRPIDDPSTPGPDDFERVSIHQRIDGEYPQTATDWIYLRLSNVGSRRPGRWGNSLITTPRFVAIDDQGAEQQYIIPSTIDEMRSEPLAGDDTGRLKNTWVCAYLDAREEKIATVVSTHTFPRAEPGRVEALVDIEFRVLQDFRLKPGTFRLFSIVAMFADQGTFDANRLLWEDPQGKVYAIKLNNDSPRGWQRLFAEDRPVGSWIAARNDGSSSWNPGAPNTDVELLSSDVPGRLGVNGMLAPPKDPNYDSLNWEFRWTSAPPLVEKGTTLRARFRVSTKPRELEGRDVLPVGLKP